MDSKLNGNVMDYLANFNAEQFIAMNTFGREECTANLAEFYAELTEMHHEIISAHAPGDSLLDVGSGPTVKAALSASAKYKNITLSDPLPQNRRLLDQYMTDSRQDEWLTEHYKLTAKLEGDVEKWQDVRDRVRASIKEAIWCDILQEQPLGTDHHGELYDCVTSSLCLEAACKDIATYNQAVRNLVSLAKPGAPVVLSGVLEEDWYKVGKNTFRVLPNTTDIIRHALVEAGCTVNKLLLRELTHRDKPQKTSSPKLFAVHAQKL